MPFVLKVGKAIPAVHIARGMITLGARFAAAAAGRPFFGTGTAVVTFGPFAFPTIVETAAAAPRSLIPLAFVGPTVRRTRRAAGATAAAGIVIARTAGTPCPVAAFGAGETRFGAACIEMITTGTGTRRAFAGTSGARASFAASAAIAIAAITTGRAGFPASAASLGGIRCRAILHGRIIPARSRN